MSFFVVVVVLIYATHQGRAHMHQDTPECARILSFFFEDENK